MEGAIEPLGHWAAFLTNETSGKVSTVNINVFGCFGFYFGLKTDHEGSNSS